MFEPEADYWMGFHAPPDERNPWQWAADTIKLKNSPFGSRFLPEMTPWLKEPLEEIAKNENTEITCQCCVQGGKTIMMQVAAAYAIAFEPGPMMFNCQTDDDSDDFAKERFSTTLLSIPGIEARLPQDKSRRSYNKLSLTDMFLLIQGANRQNLQSKSIRWLFNDEVFLWKAGLLDEARKRTTQYWNRRRVNGSTAGDKDSDLDRAFEAGDKREWHLACPACGQLNLPKWERINYKASGGQKDDGTWDYKIVKAKTVFVCEHCGAQHLHTETIHKQMNAGAKYIATNPNPTPGWLSFRWNALCLSPSVCSWGDLAVEWLKAEAEYAKGNEAPRKEFITKRLAESYDPNKYVKFEKLPTVEIKGDWADEAYRFLTVDVQETEFWAVVRAWAKSGESRLLWAGRLFTWDEIEAKQNEFKVNPTCVFIDAAYEQNKVVRECAKRNRLVAVGKKPDWLGWKALDGENQETKSFVYKPEGSKAVLLPYSYPAKYLSGTSGVSTGQTFAKFHLWSNRTIKDILFRLRNGKGAKWLAYDGAPVDWHEQMYSERRVKWWDKKGQEKIVWERIGKRANHLWDCEAMQVVAACMAQIIGEPIVEDKKEEKTEAVAAN